MSDECQQQEHEPPQSGERSLTPCGPEQRDKSTGNQHDGGRQPLVPGRDEILVKVSALPGLVAMGVLSPQKCNAMRAAYDTILTNLDESQVSSAVITDENVLMILRRNPEHLELISQVLTKEQLELIGREAANE